ncbi:MAG: DNA-directed RNA polymerase subunit omega [Christensenellaceae bacterium]|jgi:DNA-directed RNA polymerase omega subunit|nr:DNA-directed RNA polymerase subunit omega [Christensenellaceae bacterium]
MTYFNFEDCVKSVGNKYMLAVLVAKRIKDLARNSPALFNEGNTKELTYVLDEVSTRKIQCTHQF